MLFYGHDKYIEIMNKNDDLRIYINNLDCKYAIFFLYFFTSFPKIATELLYWYDTVRHSFNDILLFFVIHFLACCELISCLCCTGSSLHPG